MISSQYKTKNQNNEMSQTIDYKNLPFLKTHLMENGRIMPSRITGVSVLTQRQITHEIKLARFLALLPYTDHQSN